MDVGQRVYYAPSALHRYPHIRGTIARRTQETERDRVVYCVNWDGHTTNSPRGSDGATYTDWEIEALCCDCDQPVDWHDKATFKCLFGAGHWR